MKIIEFLEIYTIPFGLMVFIVVLIYMGFFAFGDSEITEQENECKLDCEKLGMEFFKYKFKVLGMSNCICLDNGEIKTIW